MKICKLHINDLTPYEKNAKIHTPEQIEQIKASITQFGMNDPIGVWGDKNIIVEGHGRLMALKELGHTEVDCIRLDHLSDDERKAYTLAHNKLTLNTDFDFDLLQSELDAIELDMSEFGFEELEAEIVATEQDEVVPEVPDEPKSKLGDVYQLGEHRLMCGDSTSINDVEKLMNGQRADMVFTDPPYLMGFEGNVNENGTKGRNAYHAPILNDKMSKEDGDKFLDKINAIIKEFCVGCFYISFYRLGIARYWNSLERNGIDIRSLIIWNKNNFNLSNADYKSKYEPIFFGWIKEHRFYGEKGEKDVWDIDKTKVNDLHPTMKPVELVARAIRNSSKKMTSCWICLVAAARL